MTEYSKNHSDSYYYLNDYFIRNLKSKITNDSYLSGVISVEVTKEYARLQVSESHFNKIKQDYVPVEVDENYSETHERVSFIYRDVEVYAIIEKEENNGGNE